MPTLREEGKMREKHRVGQSLLTKGYEIPVLYRVALYNMTTI